MTLQTVYILSQLLKKKFLILLKIEKPLGVIIQFGGQTPLKLADTLSKHNINILGTSIDAIDISEDEGRFQELIKKTKIKSANEYDCTK